MTFTVLLAAPLLFAAASNDHDADAKLPAFAAPIPLAEPAAAAVSKLLYPTPVLHDVDGDGQLELILGDLIGNLFFCEKLEGGPMAWSEPENLKDDHGKALKFSNW